MTSSTQVDCYRVNVDRFSWGFFVVHPNGMMMAHTDYGTYGYIWGHRGNRSIKEYLVGLTDTEYLLSKVSRRTLLDVQKTEKAFKEHILYLRRRKSITKDRALELYEDLTESSDGEEMIRWAMDEGEFYNSDGAEMIHYDYPIDARAFAERMFPLFQDLLRAELDSVIDVPTTQIPLASDNGRS
jgi:hypothetical protein